MLLHDSLDMAVADVHADLPTLTAASRSRGLAIRRRRRALATVGTIAAATVLAAGGYALLPGDAPPAHHGGAASDPVDATPPSGRTAPITGSGIAAALEAAVDEVADGSFSRFQGDTSGHDGIATLLFEPADGSGPAGQVLVNLRPASIAGEAPYTCDGYLEDPVSDCVVRSLPNGATLRTYRETDDAGSGKSSRSVTAEVIDPARGLRVLVYAMNTNPWNSDSPRVEPVLTTAQLTTIATQPWWDRSRLPIEYVKAGSALEDYTEGTDKED